ASDDPALAELVELAENLRVKWPKVPPDVIQVRDRPSQVPPRLQVGKVQKLDELRASRTGDPLDKELDELCRSLVHGGSSRWCAGTTIKCIVPPTTQRAIAQLSPPPPERHQQRPQRPGHVRRDARQHVLLCPRP